MENTKSKIVYDYIKDQIISGDLPPGSKIPSEAKLCRQFDVSRITIREALERLTTMGLLVKKKHGSTFVSMNSEGNFLKMLTPSFMHHIDYNEMLEFRYALDSYSTTACIDNIDDKGIHKLENLILLMEEYINDEKFFYADKQFHLTISKYTNNSLVHNISEVIWEVFEQSSKHQYPIVRNEERIHEHKEIVKALKAKDKELARTATAQHLSRTLMTLKNDSNK